MYLAATGGVNTVQLSWNADAVPALGYAVYRLRGLDRSDLYLGSQYPSTVDTSYRDAPPFGGSYTYIVRPVNLNGQEGTPVTVDVIVDPDILLRDSFESN